MRGRDMSAHESASTIGKKMANSTVGKRSQPAERGASASLDGETNWLHSVT